MIRKILPIGACLSILCATLLAGSWSGMLVDASCVQQKGDAAACKASPSTSAFALALDGGQVAAFDATGNTKAAEIVKSAQNADAGINVEVSGEYAEGVIKVESIERKQ
jgi:hypothetical protein